MLKQFGVRANKIYQSDFLKVAILNRSVKVEMTGFFCRAHFHSLLSAESGKKSNAGVRANKIFQSHFFKVAILNRSTKGAMIGSFRKAHFPQPSISRK